MKIGKEGGRGGRITLLLIIVLAGLGTAYILIRTATYGIGVEWSHPSYCLSTALNFLAGEGWRDFRGEPLTIWPPLLPLLLAAGGWVGIDPLQTGRWINAAAFGLTIFAAGCWLRSNLRSRGLALAATATILAFLPLIDWASELRTDPLFVLLTLLALMQLASFLDRKTAWPPLLLAAVFTALAAITRYPGVALIGTGVLVLLPLARRKHTVVFGAVSSVPLLAVLVYNWAATGNLTQATGDRTKMLSRSEQSLSGALHQTVEVFLAWTVPSKMPEGFAYLLWLAVAVVVLASVTVVLRALRPDQKAAPAYLRLGPVLPFGAFTVIYSIFLIVVGPFTSDQVIDTRYLLPVYVPLVLMAALLLDRFVSIEATGRMRAVRYIVESLVVLATLVHVNFSAREDLRLTNRRQVRGHTGHLDNAHWRHSETLQYLRDNPIEGRVYSNGRRKASLTWFWDRTAPPGKHRRIPESWAEIEIGAYIVWFGESHKHGYDVLFRDLPGIERVAELADGVVYRRTAANPAIFQQADDHIVRAGWSVYRIGRKLLYFKNPCDPAGPDLQAKFVLHVVPTDPADLPAPRQQYSSDNLDFYFDQHGKRIADQCMVLVPLPAYPIDRIYIGQWISAENRTVWEAELTPSR